MTQLQSELDYLKEILIEMMELVQCQLEKTREAFINHDVELAEEILHNEIRIDAFDINISRECGNILALYSPVATDLRFVLAVLDITAGFERIGDHASNIAEYVINSEKPIRQDLLLENELDKMFDISLNMVRDVIEGFLKEDHKIARKIFKQDKELNKINRNSSNIISAQVLKEPEIIRQALHLFSTIAKLERVGDLSKNIAEEIIFYIDAKILKHKNKTKRLRETE